MPRLLIYFCFERFDVALKKCMTLALTAQKRQWPETLLCFQKQGEWIFFFNPKLYFPLSFISGSYVTNLLGRAASSLKSAFAAVDSQHSCNNSRHDDSEDSCHQPWHIHSRCVTFKDKYLNKTPLQAPLQYESDFNYLEFMD